MRSPVGSTAGATRRLVLAALFAGLGVLLSSFAVPVGASRVFPFQHVINAVAGVLLGPWWAAGSALVTATLRFSLGTGSIFAFPGSPFGALASASPTDSCAGTRPRCSSRLAPCSSGLRWGRA